MLEQPSKPRLYQAELPAGPDSRITLATDGNETTCALYSEEGFSLVAALWMKLSAQYRRMYEPRWLGVPVIQFPEDIIVTQELIWRLRPDVILECGIAHGGSLVLFASLCELLGHGRVIGIDVEIRPHNRANLDAHFLRKRIDLIEGSSIAPEVFAQAQSACVGVQTVLVFLDSNHSAKHVAAELELYHRLVTPGSYLVAMDGSQRDVWDIPRGKPEWRNDHPLVAIEAFLPKHPEFVQDPYYTRMAITSSPGGYLRRRLPEEVKTK